MAPTCPLWVPEYEEQRGGARAAAFTTEPTPSRHTLRTVYNNLMQIHGWNLVGTIYFMFLGFDYAKYIYIGTVGRVPRYT